MTSGSTFGPEGSSHHGDGDSELHRLHEQAYSPPPRPGSPRSSPRGGLVRKNVIGATMGGISPPGWSFSATSTNDHADDNNHGQLHHKGSSGMATLGDDDHYDEANNTPSEHEGNDIVHAPADGDEDVVRVQSTDDGRATSNIREHTIGGDQFAEDADALEQDEKGEEGTDHIPDGHNSDFMHGRQPAGGDEQHGLLAKQEAERQHSEMEGGMHLEDENAGSMEHDGDDGTNNNAEEIYFSLHTREQRHNNRESTNKRQGEIQDVERQQQNRPREHPQEIEMIGRSPGRSGSDGGDDKKSHDHQHGGDDAAWRFGRSGDGADSGMGETEEAEASGIDHESSSSFFNCGGGGGGGRPPAGSFSGNDVDEGQSRGPRAAAAEQRKHDDDDYGDARGGDDDDCREGQGQRRARVQRREHFLSMIAGSFRGIGSCYVQANSAIRDVENKQRNMLENEKEISEDLLNFGVRVREATELMQRQIFSAFEGHESTSGTESAHCSTTSKKAQLHAGSSLPSGSSIHSDSVADPDIHGRDRSNEFVDDENLVGEDSSSPRHHHENFREWEKGRGFVMPREPDQGTEGTCQKHGHQDEDSGEIGAGGKANEAPVDSATHRTILAAGNDNNRSTTWGRFSFETAGEGKNDEEAARRGTALKRPRWSQTAFGRSNGSSGVGVDERPSPAPGVSAAMW